MEILIVDDDETLSQSLTMLLEGEGYTVTPALSGERALELAALQYYDLVLCDVRMPGMNGLEAIKELKESIADAHFLVMTGYASEDAPIEALRLGVDDYLAKPFDLPIFLDKVREIAKRRKRAHETASVELRGLIRSLKERFPELAERCETVEEICRHCSEELGFDSTQSRILGLASWLHPLGGVPAKGESPPTETEVLNSSDQLAVLLRGLSDARDRDTVGHVLSGAVAIAQGRAPSSDLPPEVAQKLPQGKALQEPSNQESSSQGVVVTTFGRLKVSIDGRTVERKDWQSANARWVFLYLLTRRRQAVPEGRLAELFWPGSPPTKAHRALVSSVHRARKALGDSSLIARYDRSYGISRECDYVLDCEQFLDAYKKGCQLVYQKVREGALECFERMTGLYAGDFIPECEDQWCVGLRHDFKLKMVDALEKGAAILLESDPTQAESWARRALDLDGASEPAWSVLLKALAAQGRRHEVESTYQECVKTLQEMLELKPGMLLQKTYRQSMA